MELQLAGPTKKKVVLSDVVYGCDFNGSLIHQVVTAFLAGARAGTQAQKTRSAVRGGGAKPFKQKGSGRARAGTIRSPLWRKGGVVFAAQPRSYKQKVNKKMYRSAMRSILSELIRLDRLLIVDSFDVDTPKTKDFSKKLMNLNLSGDVLIVVNELQENLYLAARNLLKVDVRDAMSLDPVALVRAEKVVVTVEAIKQIEELFL